MGPRGVGALVLLLAAAALASATRFPVAFPATPLVFDEVCPSVVRPLQVHT